jgi:radical SAM protein with 4Fe4S-binding SPASM domain
VSVTHVETFLNDNNPDVRKAGIAAIIGSNDPFADELIAMAVNDKDVSVFKAARRALLHRQPWLRLEPFPVRPVPTAALSTPEGKAWHHLHRGISRFIHEKGAEIRLEDLLLWDTIPGALPDVIEALGEVGLTTIAGRLAEQTHLYGRQHTTRQQILVAPTYQCNLSCDYCYAKGWEKDIPDEMSLRDMELAFTWMSGQGINYLILCGGEPTVYSQFPVLLQKARDRGILIMLTTNGLYSNAVQEFIHQNYIAEFIGHYDQATMLGNNSGRRQFMNNLTCAKKNGINVILRYTLTEKSTQEEWSDVIAVARSLDAKIISYGFAFKNIAGNNSYFGFHPGTSDRNFCNIFAQFAKDCHAHSLKLHQSKPFPLCMVDKDILRSAICSGSIRTSCTVHVRNFSHNVTINPDLSTFPCNGLGIRSPKITEFKDMATIGRYFTDQLEKLRRHPFDPLCEKCMLFYRGFCQGVCLAQHYNQITSGVCDATIP